MSRDETAQPEGLPPELAEALGAIGDADRGKAQDPSAGFDALLTSVGDPNERRGVRELPPAWRAAISLVVVAVMALGVGLVPTLFKGATVELTTRFAITVAALTASIVLGVWLAFRPLYRPSPPAALRWGLLGIALGLPLTLSLFPPAACFVLEEPDSTIKTLLGADLACLLTSLAVAAPVVVVWAIIQRARRWMVWPAILMASAASLTGYLSLEMHCSINHRAHLIIGHFGAALIVVASVSAWVLFRKR